MSQRIKSPCVNICALDEQDICVGCYRTGDEIAQWTGLTDAERTEVLQQVAARERAAMNFIPVPGVPAEKP